jgi:hypothetical protein
VVREGVGAGGRNEPSFVCTYEYKRKMKKKIGKKKRVFSCLAMRSRVHI